MKVKPAPGRAVRWPGTKRLLNSAGEDVPSSSYWLLLLRNRDVIEVTGEAAASTTAQPTEQLFDATHDAVQAPVHAEEAHG